MQIESLRNERFTFPITINKPSKQVSQVAQSPLILKYSLEKNENIPKQAVNGLISYGLKNNCQSQAKELACLLEKPILQKNYKAIGDIAIHLYTKQSFLYRDINKYLRDAQFESTDHPNNSLQSYSHIYDLLSFCFLLNDYMKERTRREQFKGTVYCSCNLNQQQINEYIANIGEYRQWNGFTSTTKDRKKAQTFGNVLFLIKLGESQESWGFHNGLDIQKYSAFPLQEEVLLFAGMQVMTEKVVKSVKRYFITILCLDMGI